MDGYENPPDFRRIADPSVSQALPFPRHLQTFLLFLISYMFPPLSF